MLSRRVSCRRRWICTGRLSSTTPDYALFNISLVALKLGHAKEVNLAQQGAQDASARQVELQQSAVAYACCSAATWHACTHRLALQPPTVPTLCSTARKPLSMLVHSTVCAINGNHGNGIMWPCCVVGIEGC